MTARLFGNTPMLGAILEQMYEAIRTEYKVSFDLSLKYGKKIAYLRLFKELINKGFDEKALFRIFKSLLWSEL